MYDSLSEEERKELISSLKDSADNLYLLLEQLLTWSRSQRGQIEFNPTLINLKEICDNVISTQKLTALNKKINLISEINCDIQITADSNMLTTVIRNLVSNSFKFTKPQGEVKISCHEPIEEVLIKNNLEVKPDKFIEIWISDNGIGMNENVKNKTISNRFYT